MGKQTFKPKGKEFAKFFEEWKYADHQHKTTAMVEAWGASYGTMANWFSQAADIILPEHEIPYGTLEEHFAAFIENDRLASYHQKIPSELTIKIKTDKPIVIAESADWHIGMNGTAYVQLLDDINWMASTDPKLFKVLIGGDTLHNIIQQSKMGSSHNQQYICSQKAAFYQILERLGEHILAMGTGNHNFWSALLTGEDWDMETAHRLRLIYLKHRAYIRLVIGEMDYPIIWMHKGKYASGFNPTHSNKQYQRLYYPDARIIIKEHTHKADMETYEYHNRQCVALIPGSYAVDDDFAQSEGYAPCVPHNPAVVLWPKCDKLLSFFDMRDAYDYVSKL